LSTSATERKGRRRGRRGAGTGEMGSNGKEEVATTGQHLAEAPAPRRGLPPAVFENRPSRLLLELTHSRALPSLPVDRSESRAEPA